MSNWLEKALSDCHLTEEVEGYLLGRGAKESTIRDEGVVTWFPLKTPVSDPLFLRFGKQGRGEGLTGYLIVPMYSPLGEVIGFEARNIHQKIIRDYRLPETAHHPFWLGTRRAVQKMWAGGDVWVVEGFFDLCPMEWVIPETDAILASVTAKLSPTHIEFLRRFCRGTVNMVYDRDAGGRKGTVGFKDETGKRRFGALDWLRRVGLNSRDVPYEGGKDPGELWDRGGAAAVRNAFNSF